MLKARACSIYAQRPRTCRYYDCRIFVAAGIDAGDGKDAIDERVRMWEFSYESDVERRAHEAVRAAAAFVRGEHATFPGGAAPSSPDQIAVLALKAYGVFLEMRTTSAAETAAAVVAASRSFDATPWGPA